MRDYYEIMNPYIIIDKDSFSNEYRATQTVRIKDDKKIISYLEQENDLLHKTLKNLKDYCGEDFVKASQELEDFLKKFKVKEL